jgi:histone H3/H4
MATTIENILDARRDARDREAAERAAAEADYLDLVRKSAAAPLTKSDSDRFAAVLDLLKKDDAQVLADVTLVRRFMADSKTGPKAGELAKQADAARHDAESFAEETARLAEEAAERARRETIQSRDDEGKAKKNKADALDREHAEAVAAARRLAADLRGPYWRLLGLDDPAPFLESERADLERRRRLRGVSFDHAQYETKGVEAASGDRVTAFSAGYFIEVVTGRKSGTDGMMLNANEVLDDHDMIPLAGQTADWLDAFMQQARKAKRGTRPILIAAGPASVVGIDKLRPDEAIDLIRRRQLNPERTTFFPHPDLPLADFRRVLAEPKPNEKRAAVEKFMLSGGAV